MSGDQYVWGSSVTGSWDVASNWNDVTSGQSPANVAPGVNDSVTINAAGGGATHVISGTGNSASLTLKGSTRLAGRFRTGSFALDTYASSLVMTAGSALTVTGGGSLGDRVSLTANGSGLTFGGTVSSNAASIRIGGGTAATIGGSLSTSDNSSANGTQSTLNITGASLTIGVDLAWTYGIATVDNGSLTINGNITSANNATGSEGVASVHVQNVGSLLVKHGISDGPRNNNTGANDGNLDISIASGSTATVEGDVAYNDAGDTLGVDAAKLTIKGDVTTTSSSRFTVVDDATLSILGDFTTSSTVGPPTSLNVDASTVTVGGTLSNSNLNGDPFITTVSNHGSVQLGGLQGAVQLVVDAGSSLEVGTAGGAAAGSITIDNGITVTVGGPFTAPAFQASSIVDNGTIVATNGLKLNGSLTGSGQVQIAAGANLTVQSVAADSANSIAFTGTGGALTVSGASLNGSGIFLPTISGFDASDVIDFQGAVTDAAYANGILTLTNDGATVAKFKLSGNYGGQKFIAVSTSSGLSQIDVIGAGDTSTPPPGTSTGDQYVWGNLVAGSWDVASNWNDVTSGQSPANVAPGVNDSVTINAAGGGATHVISGTGNSVSLTLKGATRLAGRFRTGSFALDTYASSLVMTAGSALTVTGGGSLGDRVSLTANGSGLTFGGTVSSNAASIRIGGGTAATIGGSLSTSDNSSANGTQSTLNITGASLTIGVDLAWTYGIATVDNGSLTINGNITSANNATGSEGVASVHVQNVGSLLVKHGISDGPRNNNTGANDGNLDISIASGSTATVEGDVAYNDAGDTLGVDAAKLTIKGDVTTTSSSRFTVVDDATLSILGDFTTSSTVGPPTSLNVDASTVTVGGTLSNSNLNGDPFITTVSNHGSVQLGGLQGAVQLVVDAGSSLEVGTAGGAAAGSITIDNGITVTVGGPFTAPAFQASSIVDNGTIVATNGLKLNGSLTGSGQVQIAAGANLTVQSVAADSANSIAFTGTGGALTLSATSLDATNTFAPLISGFDASDVIDFQGAVTDATYANGTLSLTNDGATVANISLTGSYDGQSFNAVPVANGMTQVALGPRWLNPKSGDFSIAAQWSTGKTPGAQDSVAISTTGSYIVSLTAPITVHSLMENATGATLAITNSGGVENVTQNLTINGGLKVDASGGNGGSGLNVGGLLTNSGVVTIGNATLAAATGVTLGRPSAQPALAVRASFRAAAAAPSAQTSGLVNTGTVNVRGSTTARAKLNVLGAVGGTGLIHLIGNGTAEFAGSVANQTIRMSGVGNVLQLDAPGSFGGAITGFVAGDTIDLRSGIVTALGYDGSRLIATLSTGAVQSVTVAATFAGLSATLDGHGGTNISVIAGPFTLTAGRDVVCFRSGTNTVNGSAATLTGSNNVAGGSGVDTLALSGGGTFNLAKLPRLTGFEQITLSAGANYAIASGNAFVPAGKTLTVSATALGSGNALAFDGSGETDGSFVLAGGAGADTLTGGAMNDVFNGAGGADSMTGRAGNNVFTVDDAGDKVFEAANGGTDVVRALTSYTLAAGQEIEALVADNAAANAPLDLAGNEFANTIKGNAGANSIDGRGGADVMYGYGGNDTYFVDNAADKILEAVGGGTDKVSTGGSYVLGVGQEIETLRAIDQSAETAINLGGNEFANILLGNAGNNVLKGGAAADSMYGYAGNDIYYVDDVHDKIVETTGNGSDKAATSVSYTLAAGQEIETLQAYGTPVGTMIKLTGNEISNTLLGDANDDILNGGANADKMYGYGGNDTFYVDNLGDKAFEAAGGGTDRVLTSVSFALAAGQEIETLQAYGTSTATPINLSGNETANTLIGNADANMIDGGAGIDKLYGYGGNDTFVFDTAPGTKTNVDTIGDFTVGQDMISLSRSIYGALSTGALSDSAFTAGAAATTADQHVIYNSATGGLFYDADGSGAGAAVQFARLSTGLAPSSRQFQVTA